MASKIHQSLTFSRSIGNDGTKFYLRTNRDAPKYKIIAFDIADKSFTQTTIIPEQSDGKLEYAYMVDKDKIVTVHKRNVRVTWLTF